MTSLFARIGDQVADYLPGLPKSAPRFVTDEGRRVQGVIATFEDVPTVVHAAESVRDAGYKRWDLNSPFPIHDIETSMGFRKTILPYIVFGAGMGGVAVAAAIQWFMNDIDYEFIVQGKPTGAFEAYVPILFELGVLHAAFAALLGMLALNGLPRWNHPLFSSEAFLTTSDDRFVIGIEATDSNFDPEATRDLLEKAGATSIEIVEEDEA